MEPVQGPSPIVPICLRSTEDIGLDPPLWTSRGPAGHSAGSCVVVAPFVVKTGERSSGTESWRSSSARKPCDAGSRAGSDAAIPVIAVTGGRASGGASPVRSAGPEAPHHRARPGCGLPAASSQPAFQGTKAERLVRRGFDLCRDQDGPRLGRLHGRRLRPPHRRPAGVALRPGGLRAGRAGAKVLRPSSLQSNVIRL